MVLEEQVVDSVLEKAKVSEVEMPYEEAIKPNEPAAEDPAAEGPADKEPVAEAADGEADAPVGDEGEDSA